jgi:hypothetical protein
LQKLEGRLNDLESENYALKQENLKLTKKCEENNFVVNKLQRESSDFSEFLIFFFLILFQLIFI